jgi:Glyoxalase-like domain
MRLDHVSYVASHDQISDVVQRIGSQIGTAFVDGGIHPRFGTRNFTAPLLNGQYLEVVCPLDHPAAEQTPFGKAVSRKANEGGGWLTWVFSSEDLGLIEQELGRASVEGHRRRPDGTELSWNQIGIIELLDEPLLPFFIKWNTLEHPSTDGKASAKISEIVMAGSDSKLKRLLPLSVQSQIESEIPVKWESGDEEGIIKIAFKTLAGEVLIN